MSYFQEILEKRAILDTELKNLEKQIYDFETTYLEETGYSGNILKGWDGFIQSKSKINSYNLNKKQKINNNERIFSLSSLTSPCVQLELSNQQKVIAEDTDDISQIAIASSNYRSKRIKKKKNYAQMSEGNNYKNNSSKDQNKYINENDDKASSVSQDQVEEIYNYDFNEIEDMAIDSQIKEKSPKKKKIQKKYKLKQYKKDR